MNVVLAIVGFIWGLSGVLAACWAIFVYPHAEVSLKSFWISLGAGIGAGVVIIAIVAYWISFALR